MEEVRKRNYRQLAFAIQTIHFHYTGKLVSLDELDNCIRDENQDAAQRELQRLLNELSGVMVG